MRVKMTKALSLLLCLLMLVNMLPVSALASEATPDEPSAQTEQQPAECQHTGGSATCKALAVCDNCKQSYGEYAAHSGGTATCTALAVCETCGEGYGALAEHSYSAGVCTACNGADPNYVPPCEHTGGTATCTAQAVCAVCAAAYGELADHSYDNGVCVCGEVCAHAEYAEGKCTLCGAAQPEVVCTCESTDPGEHAPFCDLYVRTNEPCLCVLSCAEEGLNDWCEACWFEGVDACNGGEEDQIPYTPDPCGDSVTYKLDDTGTLTISGTGEMYNWSYENQAPWYGSGTSIKKVVIEGGVTSIGNYAFYGCSSLTSVVITDSVTSIGNDAFRACSGLTSVEIPNSVTSIGSAAFSGCSSLTSVNIPGSVTIIYNHAFYGCSSLASVVIPDSVTSIGNSAFSGCSSLASVVIPDSVTSIGNSAFSGCSGLTSVTIGNSVTSIGDYAFQDCSVLMSVEIPDSVTSIGEEAFAGCTSLTSAKIGDSVKSIGNEAFKDCIALASVEIPDSVTSIGTSAFYGCSGLTSVTIGNSVKKIDRYAFNGCSSLTSVVIPDSVTSIGASAFNGCSSLTSVTIGNSVESIGTYAFKGCSSLTSVVIPDSVTSIGNDAFKGCSGLTSVTIGNSVESIGNSAFNGCSGLTSVTIGNSVESIGNSAFSSCWALTSVTIGNSVTSIGNSAFRDCWALTSVVITDSVTSIGQHAFLKCSALESVTIGNSVTGIGDGAFERCSALKSVNAPCKCRVDGQSLYNGQKLLYTFDDGVTITLAKHKAVDTGSCICGYNPIAFVTVTGDPISWDYAPDATATLTATATLEAGYTATTTSYAWTDGSTGQTCTLTNLDAGDHSYTCTVTVDGYTKTSDVFTVSVSKAESTVTAAPTGCSLTYSGEGQYLIDQGNASGGTMQYSLDGESYSETIPQGTAVGEYTVYYKVVGDGNHNDTAVGSVTATIAPKSIADCSVSLSENDFTYSGSAPMLNVNAVNNGISLVRGTDYELGSVEKNAGSYTVTVTGKGNYTGSVELSYTIRKSTSSIEFKDFNPTWTYTGEEFPNPTASYLTITGAGYEDVRFTWYKDGEPIFGRPIDAGTYKVVAKIPESENTHRSEALADNIIVKPLTAEVPTITLDDKIYDYDGKAKTPAVTVEYDGKVIPASEYTVSYSNNINAGTAIVTITDNPGGNYIVNGSAQFTIKPCVITVSGITAMGKVYDGSTFAYLGDGEPSYSNIPEGEDPRFVIQVALSYDSAAAGEDKPISIEVVDVGVADGYNAKNYVLVTDKIYADIRPKDISVAASCKFSLANNSFVYSGEAPELTVTGVDSSVGNTPLTENTDYTVGTAQVNAGSHKLSVTGQGNYTGTVEFSYTITKADSSVTQVPVAVSDLTFNGGNQNLITAGTANGGTMQYRLSQNESYTATIPTGKDAGTYTVYYKVAGDSNHNDTVEATVTVTIAKAAAAAAKIPVQKHFHDYATANTLALSQYLPADRGETTYTLGTITGNFFAEGTAVTETGGLTYSTRVMDAVATGSIAVNVVMENYEDVTLTVPVELVAVNAQTEKRIVKNALTEVPAGLANTAFNTLEKIKAEQQRVLRLLLGRDPQGNIAHYDVKLQFSPDDGKTWVDATEENFPAGGLTVTLPYPSGTGKDSHKFVVSHMFTTGNKAGTTEIPAVTKTAEGIQFTVTGLSPVSVAWSAIPFDVNIATVTNGTVYVSPAHTTAGTQVTITVTPKSGYKLSTLMVKDAAGNSYAISTDNNGKYYFTMPAANVTVTATFSRISTATADPTNPKTGDDFGVIFWSGMMMTSLFGMAVMVLEKKKFYRR